MELELVRKNHDIQADNSNRIPLIINIYSSENPPKMIEFNTAGNCIMKGHCGKSLVAGECIIEKLQIREVSSHFRNGWIFLVVKPVPLGKNEYLNTGDIDPSLVEPLIIEN